VAFQAVSIHGGKEDYYQRSHMHWPDLYSFKAQFIEGVTSPITSRDIDKPDSKATGRRKAFAVHLIRRLIINASDFHFHNYKYNDNVVFTRPT
jgi:hypothetical protein